MSKKGHSDFKLTDEQKREMARLEAASYIAQTKRIKIIRGVARALEITAKSLDDLRSEDGRLFIEIENAYGGYRQAICRTEDRSKAPDQHAYFCQELYMPKGFGCDWVIGEPTQQDYNEIGFLCGSAGVRYFCRICGKEIGKVATMHS
ncbi:MAG: hypothetical protein OIN66_07175 [Candidatus Methanoperedens sp.]|nr:hypothetical protein [Candidatus Methanoperedens sp.]